MILALFTAVVPAVLTSPSGLNSPTGFNSVAGLNSVNNSLNNSSNNSLITSPNDGINNSSNNSFNTLINSLNNSLKVFTGLTSLTADKGLTDLTSLADLVDPNEPVNLYEDFMDHPFFAKYGIKYEPEFVCGNEYKPVCAETNNRHYQTFGNQCLLENYVFMFRK